MFTIFFRVFCNKFTENLVYGIISVLNGLIEVETHSILSLINKPQSKFYQVNQVYQCDDQKFMVTLDVIYS